MKSTLVIIPQYPVLMRYQEWWLHELCNHLSPLHVINPNVSSPQTHREIKQFSIVTPAVEYELRQIQHLHNLLETLPENTVLFFADISFPGLFVGYVPLIKKLRPDVKLVGFCHATSANYKDFWEPVRNVKHVLEQFVFDFFDVVFVSTEYHANKLCKHFSIDKTKIIITYGLPVHPLLFEFKTDNKTKKCKTVVITSRIDPQKIDMVEYDEITRICQKHGVEVVITQKVCSSWESYYNTIAKSSLLIMTGLEDTFGYPCLEATLLKTPILAPRRCCYPEILTDDCIFSTASEFEEKLEAVLEGRLTQVMCRLKDMYIEGSKNFWNTVRETIEKICER